MLAESFLMAPVVIGLVLYLYLGAIGLVWFIVRSSTRWLSIKIESQEQ